MTPRAIDAGIFVTNVAARARGVFYFSLPPALCLYALARAQRHFRQTRPVEPWSPPPVQQINPCPPLGAIVERRRGSHEL